MGMPITVAASGVVAGSAVFDTDRSVTGQDGASFASAAEAEGGTGLAARLAARLFATVPDLSGVFIASSQLVLGRSSSWDDASLAAARETISRFFVFYDGA